MNKDDEGEKMEGSEVCSEGREMNQNTHACITLLIQCCMRMDVLQKEGERCMYSILKLMRMTEGVTFKIL